MTYGCIIPTRERESRISYPSLPRSNSSSEGGILFDHPLNRELPLCSLPRSLPHLGSTFWVRDEKADLASRSATSPLLKTNPTWPSCPTTSGMPPASEAITGVPHAIASATTKPKASCQRDGNTARSADRKSVGTSSTWPRNSTWPGPENLRCEPLQGTSLMACTGNLEIKRLSQSFSEMRRTASTNKSTPFGK